MSGSCRATTARCTGTPRAITAMQARERRPIRPAGIIRPASTATRPAPRTGSTSASTAAGTSCPGTGSTSTTSNASSAPPSSRPAARARGRCRTGTTRTAATRRSCRVPFRHPADGEQSAVRRQAPRHLQRRRSAAGQVHLEHERPGHTCHSPARTARPRSAAAQADDMLMDGERAGRARDGAARRHPRPHRRAHRLDERPLARGPRSDLLAAPREHRSALDALAGARPWSGEPGRQVAAPQVQLLRRTRHGGAQHRGRRPRHRDAALPLRRRAGVPAHRARGGHRPDAGTGRQLRPRRSSSPARPPRCTSRSMPGPRRLRRPTRRRREPAHLPQPRRRPLRIGARHRVRRLRQRCADGAEPDDAHYAGLASFFGIGPADARAAPIASTATG